MLSYLVNFENNKLCIVIVERTCIRFWKVVNANMITKKMSMVKKYHNHTLQTNPLHPVTRFTEQSLYNVGRQCQQVIHVLFLKH